MVDVVPEPTPNPSAMKFTLDRPSTEARHETFREGSAPEDSPLGAKIFAVGGITNVFLTANFVSVTADDGVSWNDLMESVTEVIQQHFADA